MMDRIFTGDKSEVITMFAGIFAGLSVLGNTENWVMAGIVFVAVWFVLQFAWRRFLGMFRRN